MPVEEREPVQATREESKPPPNILAGPATPPIKLPDQGIDVTIPLAPVEEVSRRDSEAVPTMKAPGQSGESGESAKPAAAAPAAYKQTGTQAPASASGSRRVLVIVGVAVVLLAAAAAAYFLLGN